MLIKAMIVDDERLARKELRTLLKEHSEIEITGEAASTSEALLSMERIFPDVVFLDINMPGESGFDLVRRVSRQPYFIFVTAYDAYALQAFDVEAIDYLLKPVHPDRLTQALARLKQRGGVLDTGTDRIYLSDRGRLYLLLPEEITHISGANDYSEVVSISHGAILDSRTLSAWESILPNRFIRIHRSTIVNLDHVAHIIRDTNNAYLVHLNISSIPPLRMSRRYASRLKNRFSSI